jgi:hypothetical protein
MFAGTNGLSPLDYMLEVLRDDSKPENLRMEAAKSAAPYVHARLSNVEMAVTDETRKPEELADEELARIATGGSKGATVSQGMPQGLVGVYPGGIN